MIPPQHPIAAATHADPYPYYAERFEIHRHDRRLFTFGLGAHACPGETLARTIAGVDQLLTARVDLERFTATVIYRPSANVRVPLLDVA
jgi:cytochrome P450